MSLAREVFGARRWRLLVVASILAGTLAALICWRIVHPTMSSCEREVRYGDRRRATEICLASYERGRDERDLVWAAKAHYYLTELDRAEALAQRLIAGPRYGDAHAILSNIALRRNLGHVAKLHAETASFAHRLAGDELGLLDDVVALSKSAWMVGDFETALARADEAIAMAPRLHDPRREVAAYLARTDALRRMGDLRAATDAVSIASSRATDPCDQAWTRLKKAMCQMESGQDSLALLELTMADQANARCRNRYVSTSIALNRAWMLRRTDPAGALTELDALPSSEDDDVEVVLLRGYLAADRGALVEASSNFVRAASLEPPDADWPWEIERARAELSELRGGVWGDFLAEYHYRRATAMVASLRAAARTRSAFFVSSHRGPYDGLIALLARHGRWRDALSVILELDASDMLRATASDMRARDGRVQAPVVTASGARPPAATTIDDILGGWRSRELVIVIAPGARQVGPGRERVYRLRIADGQVTGEDVGDARTARTRADQLFAYPGDRDAARALGRMIVPPGSASTALHVLVIGALGRVPLAALRSDDGALIVGKRPLARVLALHASSPETRDGRPSVIIADPRGDLPSAADEGAMVARALGPEAQRSGSRTAVAATRARLWSARDAGLLHVAAHVGARGRWRALHLADGDVDPVEMLQHHVAPRIAVLAGCGSAAATDEEGWGSIAAALLESGTAVVLATDRSVRDDAALSLMRDFYAQPDWRADPARALARVQQAMDARAGATDDEAAKPRSWAAFSVLARPPMLPAPAADRSP